MRKKILHYFGLVILALVVVWAVWRMPSKSSTVVDKPEGSLTSSNSEPHDTTSGPAPRDSAPKMDLASTPGNAALPNKDPLAALQELLDDSTQHSQAREQAITMATSGSDEQQLAAVNALRWLGGKDAKKTLVKIMASAGEEVATEAQNVLKHLLSEDLITETPDQFEPSLWKDAITNAGNEAEQESFLVLLGAYPARHVVPVLLDLLESGDSDLKQLAQEHLEANTNGEEITTREQGEEWLAEHLREQDIQQREEEQEQAAANKNATDLPRLNEVKKLEAEEALKANDGN